MASIELDCCACVALATTIATASVRAACAVECLPRVDIVAGRNMTSLPKENGPWSAGVGRKEDRDERVVRVSCQVDSVLPADGRRPERRGPKVLRLPVRAPRR